MFLVYDMFRTSLLLATLSKTDCNALLRVSVTSLTVVAGTYMVESSAYMDTQILFNASGRSLVKTFTAVFPMLPSKQAPVSLELALS